MSDLTGAFEVVVAVRVALPPNVTPQQAVQMLSNNGVNVPVGLLQFVRQVHTEIVQPNEPATIPPVEDGGAILRLR